MRKKLLKNYFILKIIIAIVCSEVWGAGTNAGEFLLIGVGARPTAMGNSYTAVSGDVQSIAWNPAGLAYCSESQATFMHNQWLEDSRFEYFGFVNAKNRHDILGASVSYLNIGNIKGRDESGNKTSDFKAYDLGINFSYARRFSSDFSLGGNFKMIRENIENVNADALALDLGLIYNFSSSLSVGAVVQNAGPKIKFIAQKESLPLVVKAGLVYQLLNEKLTLTLDANKVKDTRLYPSLGGEYRLKDVVSFRVGYNGDPDLLSGVGLTYGLGFYWRTYSFDYSFIPYGDLSLTHRFSVTLKL